MDDMVRDPVTMVLFYKAMFKKYRPNYEPVIEWLIHLTTDQLAKLGLMIYPFNHGCYQIYLQDRSTRLGGKYKPHGNFVYMVDTYMETTYAERQGEI